MSPNDMNTHCSPCHQCPCKGHETCKVCAYQMPKDKPTVIVININL